LEESLNEVNGNELNSIYCGWVNRPVINLQLKIKSIDRRTDKPPHHVPYFIASDHALPSLRISRSFPVLIYKFHYSTSFPHCPVVVPIQYSNVIRPTENLQLVSHKSLPERK